MSNGAFVLREQLRPDGSSWLHFFAGVPEWRDARASAHWCRHAAKQGYPEGQRRLAHMYAR
jgi:TPR repeat protein